jgi:nitrogen fixation NifU-like protein
VSDLRELYQEILLEHNRHPRHFGVTEGASHGATGHNPLCGDRVTLYVDVSGDVVTRITFTGSGCAISTASASMLTEAATGLDLAAVRRLAADFVAMLTHANDPLAETRVGKLAVFAGVRDYPVRVKCATLAWHTMLAALDGTTTEVIPT